MNQKTPEIGTQARAQIADALPQAIETALSSYHAFIDNPDKKESKDFQNHHAAAKAALAHIELLIKLASIVSDESADNTADIATILADATQELNQEKGNA